MSAGDILRTARNSKGISQDDLGDRVGVSGQYIGKLERGEAKNPSRDILERIRQVLDIPFESLMFGTDAKEGLSEQDIIIARRYRDASDKTKVKVLSAFVEEDAEAEQAPKVEIELVR